MLLFLEVKKIQKPFAEPHKSKENGYMTPDVWASHKLEQERDILATFKHLNKEMTTA